MTFAKRRKSIRQQTAFLRLLAVLCILASMLLSSPAAVADLRPGVSWPNITIQMGPVEVIRGPDTVTDNPFNTLLGATSLQGYVGNSSTWGYIGGSLETLRPMSSTVLQGGTHFDSCGAWLNSVWQSPRQRERTSLHLG